MSSNKSYKQLHEEFVVNSAGTSSWECLLLVIPYPLLAFFSCYLINVVLECKSSFLRFIVEFVVIVVPLVLSLTLFHRYNYLLVLFLILAVIICLICSLWNRRKNLVRIVFTLITPVKSRPFITYFRSIVNLISVFCILAVDFRVFPRQLAKTETYGFGLMDTGVGLYIVANGIVAKPDTRDGVVKLIKSTLPIIALGVLRCISVNSLDYQHVVSEYGTHWNFFFTLAAVKLMAIFLMNVFPNRELLASVVIAMLHHCILQAGVETWLMSDFSRTNPLTANREGICSLLGYLSLFFGSVALGNNLQRDCVDLEQDLKQSTKGFVISVILNVALFWLQARYPVSRRFANITYVVWIFSMTFLLLSICILLEICLRVICFVKGVITNENLIPTILNSINYNGLVFFLLGNIFTGLINIWVQTLYVDNYNSIIILTAYMFLLCFFVNIFCKNRIKFSL